MRIAVALIILTIAACALLAAHAHKPFELRIDANPGALPTNAAASDETRMEWSDQLACMRLIVPYRVTTDQPRTISRT